LFNVSLTTASSMMGPNQAKIISPSFLGFTACHCSLLERSWGKTAALFAPSRTLAFNLEANLGVVCTRISSGAYFAIFAPFTFAH
jgi:hypothetical protein